METVNKEQKDKNTLKAEGDSVETVVMRDKFIKLKNSETLINLNAVLCVKKLDKTVGGNRFHKSRIIMINYQSGESCRLFYGVDDEFHHEDWRKNQRNSDYRQIEKSILA